MSESRTVYERVLAVLADMPAIEKGEQAPGNMGGYRFRGIEQITAALKPLLPKHGVFMVPSVLERRDDARATRGGGTLYVTDLLIRFEFYGPAGDSFCAEVWGEGTDSGDKATQKAMTSAFKSLLSVTFCIADSATDAERHDVPDAAPRLVAAPASRVNPIAAKVKELGLAGWVEDQGFVFPWTAEWCDAIEAKISETPAVPAPAGTAAVAEGPGRASPDSSALRDVRLIGASTYNTLSSRVKAYNAANTGISVADTRTARGLPKLTAMCSAEEAGGWSQMLDVLEAELAASMAPFTESTP